LEPDRLELEYSDEAQYDQLGNAGGKHALMLSLRESVTPGYFKCMKLKRCYLILAMAEWTKLQVAKNRNWRQTASKLETIAVPLWDINKVYFYLKLHEST
jgi:hypothetical protein